MSESPVHRRLRHVRMGRRSDLDVVIDGLEHLSGQITNLHDRMVLMVDSMEHLSKLQDLTITGQRQPMRVHLSADDLHELSRRR